MSNYVSKFNIDGVEAIIKDSEARTQISQNTNNIGALNNRIGEAEASVTSTNATVSILANNLATNNTKLETLESRMNGFTNLPTGSTSGDAELTDIRVAYNGSTYPSAGASVRGQVAPLYRWQNEFGYMKPTGKNLLNEADGEMGYIDSDGVLIINPSLDWKTTDFIDVSDYSVVSFSANRNGTREATHMYYFGKYDENKNFIGRDIDEQTFYTVQSGVKYVRFGWHTNEVTQPMLQPGNPSDISYAPYVYASHLHNSPYKNEAEVREIINERYDTIYGDNRNPDNDTYGYLNSSGVITSGGNWQTTDYCYVGDLTEITASAKELDASVRSKINLYFMCTYDENKNFIQQVYTIGNVSWNVTSGVSYIRFCYHDDEVEQVMVEGGSRISSTFIPYTTDYMLKPKYYDSGYSWSKYKWVAFGDSLTEANLRTTKNYHGYISDATGIEVENMGKSGTGYKRSEGSSAAFYQRIMNVPTDADVVTIFGSGNDLSYAQMGFNTFAECLGQPTDTGTNTLCGCINQTIDNLYSVLPTVQLALVTPTPWVDYPPTDSGNNMELYANAIVAICKRRGILCLDLYHCSELRPWEASYRELCYSKDEGNGVHPNELGHKIIASHFKALLSKLLL